ncbi:hypothetical protein ACQKNX_17700 [Lysinibacillus sp. NPDC093712]|uniref:hypothetical protein n=1 Tax=Lysinibacillus sp. NPDC093712 TaxID=3390579 RepID=UPI003D053C96
MAISTSLLAIRLALVAISTGLLAIWLALVAISTVSTAIQLILSAIFKIYKKKYEQTSSHFLVLAIE